MLTIKVNDFYKDELFKYIPEYFFDLLDEAFFYNKKTIKIPEWMLREFYLNTLTKRYLETLSPREGLQRHPAAKRGV